jgi:hypothetical protein
LILVSDRHCPAVVLGSGQIPGVGALLPRAHAHLLAAPFLLSSIGRTAFPLLAAGIAAFSFLRGLGQANDNATQCEVVPRQFRATGLGVMNAVSTGAGGCGVLVAGLLKRELGLDAIFAGVAGIFAVAGVSLVIGYRFWMRNDIARAQQLESRTPTRAS